MVLSTFVGSPQKGSFSANRRAGSHGRNPGPVTFAALPPRRAGQYMVSPPPKGDYIADKTVGN